MVRLHIWADASTCPDTRMAFGAFSIAQAEPVVKRLKSRVCVDAEFEIMTLAMRAAPIGSLLFTDLEHWKQTVQRFNYWQLAHFKETMFRRRIEVRYVPEAQRASRYFDCHRAAIAALREARKAGQ